MIPHNRPTFGREEETSARRVLRSGWVAPGPEVEAFEGEFCRFLGLPQNHAVALSSGTAALYMALWVLGARGKDVAFPAYACAALRNATAMIGANELLLDSRPDNPNLDFVAIPKQSSLIVIAPHMYGIPVDLSSLKKCVVVEDCAQALGARVRGRPVGLQGRVAIFSFYATKLITSGGHGGMFVSKDRALVEAVRDYRAFDGRKDRKKRFNFQMTDLQAAIGRAQLRKLPSFLSRREVIFGKYRKTGINLIDIAPDSNGTIRPVRYRAIIRTHQAKALMAKLKRKHIHSIIPLEDWELLGHARHFPNAYRWTQETLSLPIYPSLSDRDVESIVKVAAE